MFLFQVLTLLDILFVKRYEVIILKLILDIDDEILSKMQTHADIVQEDLNVMLSNLFVRFVDDANKVIIEEALKDDCREFEDFQCMLFKWMSNAAYAPQNIALHKVLLRLRDEHLTGMYLITDLYKTYKNSI